MDVRNIYDDLKFVMRNDNLASDDDICHMTLKLTNLCVNGGFDDWFDVEHEGVNRGKFHISAFWKPDNVVKAGSAEAYMPP